MKIFFSLLFIVLFACDRPEIDGAANRKLDVPALSDQSFYLKADRSFTEIFQGSMIIWNDAIPTEKLSRMIGLSKKANGIKVDIERYRLDKIVPLERQVQANNLEIQRLVKSNHGSYERNVEFAKSWFEVTLNSWKARGLVQDTDMEHARKLFQGYCEAKLVERAIRLRYLENTYSARPEPLLVCQAVYEKLGYFNDASQCSPQNEGKNYYSCLWQAGVNLTSFFKKYDRDTQEALNRYQAEKRGFTKLNEKTFLKQNGTIRDGDVKIVLSVPDLIRQRSVESNVDNSPIDIVIEAIEKPIFTGKEGDLLRFIPLGQKDIYDEATLNELAKASQQLAIMGQVQVGDNNFVELNEYLFNLPILVSSPYLQTLSEATRAGVAQLLPEIDLSIDPEVEQKIGAIKEMNKTILEEKRAFDEELTNTKLKDYEEVQFNEQLDLAIQDDVSQAFSLKAEVRLEEKDGLLKLHFTANSNVGKGTTVCFDRVAWAQVRCGENGVEPGVSIDRETGTIELTYELDSPQVVGFDYKDKIDAQKYYEFNVIPTERMQNLWFEMKLSPVRLGGILNGLQGDFVIRDREGGEIRYSGNFNLPEVLLKS